MKYVSIKYTERLTEAGIEPSVGSVGDSYDNALAQCYSALGLESKKWTRGVKNEFQQFNIS